MEPNQLRRNPLTMRWTVYTSMERAFDEIIQFVRDHVDQDAKEGGEDREPENCQFCPGNEHISGQDILILSGGRIYYRRKHPDRQHHEWDVRVVPAWNPLFRIEGKLDRRLVRMYDVMNAIGAHEIIIEHPEHHQSWATMPPEHIAKIFSVWRERVNDLSKDPRMGHVFIHKSVGRHAGAQNSHPHSHLTISPVVPARVHQLLSGCHDHYKYKERCLFCDVLKDHQKKEDCMIVGDNSEFASFAPYFSPRPAEIWIMPRQHETQFKDRSDASLLEMARVVCETFRRLVRVLGPVSYNVAFNMHPNIDFGPGLGRGYWHTLEDDFHWHMMILPRLPRLVDRHRGFREGTAFFINPALPEDVARALREVELPNQEG